jgi:hypothetical protein
MNNIRSEPIGYKDTTVALIRIQKSSTPVYVEDQDKRTGETKVGFYYLALNTTKELNIKQAAEYIKNHWKINN